MHITKENLETMIYLKIEDNKGYYWKQGDQPAYIEIDKINREDLMELLTQVAANHPELPLFRAYW
jgi:hypothetical protein